MYVDSCRGRKFWDYIGVKISLQLLVAIDAADGSDTMIRDSEKLPRSMRSIMLSFRAERQKKGSVETISFENELEQGSEGSEKKGERGVLGRIRDRIRGIASSEEEHAFSWERREKGSSWLHG